MRKYRIKRAGTPNRLTVLIVFLFSFWLSALPVLAMEPDSPAGHTAMTREARTKDVSQSEPTRHAHSIYRSHDNGDGPAHAADPAGMNHAGCYLVPSICLLSQACVPPAINTSSEIGLAAFSWRSLSPVPEPRPPRFV